jgi:hypothetical protein
VDEDDRVDYGKAVIRQLTGNTVEELLFTTYINFKNKAKDISIPDEDLADTWAQLLE